MKLRAYGDQDWQGVIIRKPTGSRPWVRPPALSRTADTIGGFVKTIISDFLVSCLSAVRGL